MTTDLRLGLLLSLGALLPMPARAQCPGGATVTLTDGMGQTWDFNARGAVVNGTDGAFDGLHTLYVDGVAFNPPAAMEMELGGRGVVFRALVTTTVSAQRHVYVPAGGRYVRYIEEITHTNPMMPPQTVTLEIRNNVGYDDISEIVTTADGDAMLEPSDAFYVLDNEFELIPPELVMRVETPPSAFCDVMYGAGARITPSAVNGTDSGFACGGPFMTDRGGTRVTWTVTLMPLQTIRIMYFTSQHMTRAAASAACPGLATITPADYADLDSRARASVINWGLDRRNGSVCGAPADCESGNCVDGVCCDTACGGGDPADCQACTRVLGAMVDGTCGPVFAGLECRMAGGICDLAERCDGTALTCPADVLHPASRLCRPSVGLCDRPESCTGTNPACPADAFRPFGSECAPAFPGTCDFGSRCSGTSGDCPPNRIGPVGAPCDDGMACTYSTCSGPMGMNCTSSTASCDDGDMCTSDSCAGTACVNTYMPGCVGGRDGGPDGGELYPDAPEADAGEPFFDGGGNFDAAGFDAAPWDAAGFDAEGFDGTIPGLDTGPRRDGSADPLRLGGGGCSCRVTGGGAPSPLLLGLTVLAVFCARRRR